MELVSSKSEARRLISQGGICLDGKKVENIEFNLKVDRLELGCVVKKGKKIYKKAVLSR